MGQRTQSWCQNSLKIVIKTIKNKNKTKQKTKTKAKPKTKTKTKTKKKKKRKNKKKNPKTTFLVKNSWKGEKINKFWVWNAEIAWKSCQGKL